MTGPTAFHQLGRFIVKFQEIEALLNEVIALIANSDVESVSILTNDLEFHQRLKATDVLFARFLGLRASGDQDAQAVFHGVIGVLEKLAKRRNEIVHSRYHECCNVDGKHGLLRRHSRLQGKAGKREETREELQPGAFEGDLKRLDDAMNDLEKQRRKAIDLLYPT